MAHILVVGNFPATSISGHRVQTVSGYDEGIEMLKQTDFDFIIIDAVIGTTNGHAFLKWMSDKDPVPTLVRHQEPTVAITKPDNTPGTWYLESCFKHVYKFADLLDLSTLEIDERDFVKNWMNRRRSPGKQACA